MKLSSIIYFYENGKYDTIQFLFQKEILGSKIVYGIYGDKKQKLWFVTNQGLFSYKEECLLHFRKEDGLMDDEFIYDTNFFNFKNKFWLPHPAGVSVFHPDTILPYSIHPRAYIDQLMINNDYYSKTPYIGEAERIDLKYYENTLAFELLAIGYYLPKLSQLQYRLIGYDTT